MSIVDKVIAAVTPLESDEERSKARSQARAAASGHDWLSMVLDHHEQVEAAFAAVKSARDRSTRIAALKELAILLTGHSVAEEAVLYPAMARIDEKAHATEAYSEQAAAKLQLGLLENIAPMTQEFLDKLEHIRGAVTHHVYEEESTWFLQLKEKIPANEQEMLTERYQEEFERYVGSDARSSRRRSSVAG